LRRRIVALATTRCINSVKFWNQRFDHCNKMTDILCKWINDNNKFGERIGEYKALAIEMVCLCGINWNTCAISVEAEQFPSKFANGYLFGQILHQYGLQVCGDVCTYACHMDMCIMSSSILCTSKFVLLHN